MSKWRSHDREWVSRKDFCKVQKKLDLNQCQSGTSLKLQARVIVRRAKVFFSFGKLWKMWMEMWARYLRTKTKIETICKELINATAMRKIYLTFSFKKKTSGSWFFPKLAAFNILLRVIWTTYHYINPAVMQNCYWNKFQRQHTPIFDNRNNCQSHNQNRQKIWLHFVVSSFVPIDLRMIRLLCNCNCSNWFGQCQIYWRIQHSTQHSPNRK